MDPTAVEQSHASDSQGQILALAFGCKSLKPFKLVQGLGFRVQGTGCIVQGAGHRVWGLGTGVQDTGLGVEVAGYRVQGLRVQGTGFGV